MKRESEMALSSLAKPMKREDVTDLIAFRRIKKGVRWAEVATNGPSVRQPHSGCWGSDPSTARSLKALTG